MRRLTANDALLLYQERPRDDYMHCMRVVTVDLGGRSSLELLAVMERVYSVAEPYRWRLDAVPGQLHHPLWRVDPDFDVSQHIHRIGCPSPGTDRELAALVSDLCVGALDRSRPLWQAWIVEGLAGGRCAVVTKVHHALADGVATAMMAREVTQTAPTPLADLPPAPGFTPETALSGRQHFALAVKDVRSHLRHAVPALAERHREVRRIRSESTAPVKPPAFTDGPATFLNREVGARRSYAFTALPLSRSKELKQRWGTTVNDVFLSTGAGAVRRLLSERGELPEVPLIATVPVSTRRTHDDHDGTASGNQISMLAVRLRTDIADPRARTQATMVEADAAKAGFRLSAGARPENYVDCLPPVVQRGLLRAARHQMVKGKPLLGNIAMSNVPGPPDPLFLADFEIESLYGIGPLTSGVCLNITAWSYAGQLNVSFLAARDVLPDVWPLVEHFRAAFDEICAADTSPTRKDGPGSHE